MRCPKCGTNHDKHFRFCVSCGTPLRPKRSSQATAAKGNRAVFILVVGLFVAFGMAIYYTARTQVSSGLFTGNRGDERFSPDVYQIAGQFRCSCGGCDEPELSACTCPTALEEKRFIATQLRAGSEPAAVIRLVAARYGGQKEGRIADYPAQPNGTPEPRESRLQVPSGRNPIATAGGMLTSTDREAILVEFSCACGQCPEIRLDQCTCTQPHGAQEIKHFIDQQIVAGKKSREEIIQAVAYKYGHWLKERTP